MTNADYIAEATETIPEWLLTSAEWWTIIFSLIGMGLSLYLTFFFNRSDAELSKRLKQEYFTDFLGFIVLFVMGFALYMDTAWLVKVDVIIRPFVVLLNLIAMYRLLKHYKDA